MSMIGFGTRFFRESDSTPGDWEQIAGIYTISPAEMTLDTQDDTVLDSPDGVEEVVGTIIRNGDYQLELRYEPNSQVRAKFKQDLLGRKKRKYRIVDPDDDESYEEFTALVTSVGRGDITFDGSMRLNITLKVTGVRTEGQGMDS